MYGIRFLEKKVSDLDCSKYLPKRMTEDDEKLLRMNVKAFGFTGMIVVNENESRYNVLVGGHNIVELAKDMEVEVVPCLVVDVDLEEERNINKRLGNNEAEYFHDELLRHFG